MRTASAAKFVMYFDGEPDPATATTPATTPQEHKGGHESGDESDAYKSMAANKLHRKNKIWEVVGGSGNNTFITGASNEETLRSEDHENSSSPEEQQQQQQEFASHRQPAVLTPAAVLTTLDRLTATDTEQAQAQGEKLTPSCSCNSVFPRTCCAAARDTTCEGSQQLGCVGNDEPSTGSILFWQGNPEMSEDPGFAAAAADMGMRESLRASSAQKQHENLQGSSAKDGGAFGSYVSSKLN